MQTEILEKTIEVRDQLGAEVQRMKEVVADAVEDKLGAARRAVKQGRRQNLITIDIVDFLQPIATLYWYEGHYPCCSAFSKQHSAVNAIWLLRTLPYGNNSPS